CAVRPGKTLAVVVECVQLRAELHAQEQQREGNSEQRSERGDHGEVRRNSVANVSRVARSGIGHSAYIAPPAKVGANTESASSALEGSLTVIRHSVRGSSGSVSVAECRSEALSQMTRS